MRPVHGRPASLLPVCLACATPRPPPRLPRPPPPAAHDPCRYTAANPPDEDACGWECDAARGFGPASAGPAPDANASLAGGNAGNASGPAPAEGAGDCACASGFTARGAPGAPPRCVACHVCPPGKLETAQCSTANDTRCATCPNRAPPHAAFVGGAAEQLGPDGVRVRECAWECDAGYTEFPVAGSRFASWLADNGGVPLSGTACKCAAPGGCGGCAAVPPAGTRLGVCELFPLATPEDCATSDLALKARPRLCVRACVCVSISVTVVVCVSPSLLSPPSPSLSLSFSLRAREAGAERGRGARGQVSIRLAVAPEDLRSNLDALRGALTGTCGVARDKVRFDSIEPAARRAATPPAARGRLGSGARRGRGAARGAEARSERLAGARTTSAADEAGARRAGAGESVVTAHVLGVASKVRACASHRAREGGSGGGGARRGAARPLAAPSRSLQGLLGSLKKADTGTVGGWRVTLEPLGRGRSSGSWTVWRSTASCRRPAFHARRPLRSARRRGSSPPIRSTSSRPPRWVSAPGPQCSARPAPPRLHFAAAPRGGAEAPPPPTVGPRVGATADGGFIYI